MCLLELKKILEDEPEKVNDDPYGDGWMLKIELGDESDADALFSAAEYQEFVDSLD